MQPSSFSIAGSVTAVVLVLGGLVPACGGSEFQVTGSGLESGRDAGTSGGATGSSTGGQGSGGNVGTGSGGAGGGGGAGASGGASIGGGGGGGGTTSGGAGGTPGGAGGGLGNGGSGDGGSPGGGAGGSSSGGTSSGGASSGGASSGGASAGGSIGTGGGPSAGGATGCTSPTTFYPDNDGDKFGRSSGTIVACSAPPNGIWALVGGDCDDDNNLVFPGATTYYESPYSNSGGIHTFDYDCSGVEDGDPSQLGAPACSGGLGVCTKGSGYVATSRTGTGVNAVCGSKTLATCTASGTLGSCVAVRSDTSVAYRCK